jgi:hypothetical protein
VDWVPADRGFVAALGELLSFRRAR